MLDWFQIGRGEHQAVYCHPIYLTSMQSTSCEIPQAQAGIKIAGRNINNLREADDTTLMAESEELKSLLVKEESEKSGLKLSVQKQRSWHLVPSLHVK